MKTYNQFLNENVHYLNADIKNDFEFVIDVKNATQEQIDSAFDEFKKYTELEDWVKKHLVSKDNGGKVWAWRIELRKGWGFGNPPYCQFNIITSPYWGLNQGMKVMDNRITILEFIKVGLLGAEGYIKSEITYFKALASIKKRKSDANKYNL